MYPALDKSRVPVERNQWKAQSNSARAAAAQKFRWAVCTPADAAHQRVRALPQLLLSHLVISVC